MAADRAPATPTAGSPTRRRPRSGAAYAELAGGEAGVALASGMGAIHAALRRRCCGPATGSSRRSPLYGSTRAQLLRHFGGFGVRVDFVDITDLDAVAAALAAAPTRVLYAETIANPTTFVADHAALAELAHRHGAIYVVDNTFASPYVCRPLELGADLVVESATKFLGGHSDVIAGVVAGPRDLIAERRAGPDRHRRDPRAARGVPRPARDPDARRPGGAPRADGRGTGRLARASGRRARVLYPGLPEPSPARGRGCASSGPASRGGMLAFEVAGGRDGRPRGHRRPRPPGADRLARERPHDGRPPAIDVAAPARPRPSCSTAGITPGPAARLGRARGPRGPPGRLRRAPLARGPAAPWPRARRVRPGRSARLGARSIATPAAVSAAPTAAGRPEPAWPGSARACGGC